MFAFKRMICLDMGVYSLATVQYDSVNELCLNIGGTGRFCLVVWLSVKQLVLSDIMISMDYVKGVVCNHMFYSAC